MSKTLLLLAIAFSCLSYGCRTTDSGSSSDVKLIGGTIAKDGQYPASIQINRGPDVDGKTFTKCTGIPISRTHILLAAHCLFEVVDGIQQTFGLTMFYSYGVNADKLVVAGIKATYLPREAQQFLETNHAWNAGDVEHAHDVSVVELDSPIPEQVAIGTMSSRKIVVGMPFRYGGYGCEKHASTPAEEAVTANASESARLKYAQGKVTTISPLIAQGPTYEGLAKQSLCPGDSGGPVYFDAAPGDPDAKLTEFIGINNFHKLKADGDEVNSEVNFSIVTKSSDLGRWVKAVIAGTEKPFDEL